MKNQIITSKLLDVLDQNYRDLCGVSVGYRNTALSLLSATFAIAAVLTAINITPPSEEVKDLTSWPLFWWCIQEYKNFVLLIPVFCSIPLIVPKMMAQPLHDNVPKLWKDNVNLEEGTAVCHLMQDLLSVADSEDKRNMSLAKWLIAVIASCFIYLGLLVAG